MTELTRQIYRASMSHSLMNGFSAILPVLAEKNDADIECLRAENAKLRKDNDRLIQAIEDLHNVSLEDELVQLENENDKLRELAENLLMAFVVLETQDEQRKCIDRALELQRELGVLPMETFDASELGVEVDDGN